MDYNIVFDRPSGKYSEALPVGNGRLGAAVLGAVKEKHIFLNEETVWYGGPRDRVNPDAAKYIDEIRQLMRENKVEEAERLALLALTGTPETQRHFTTLGILVMDFLGHDAPVSDYTNTLNLKTATVTTKYTINGVHYIMEVFASVAENSILVRVRASEPVLSFFAGIERGERVPQFSYGTHMDFTKQIDGGRGILMGGSCGGENAPIFRGALFGTSNGRTRAIGDKLVFENATEAVLAFSGGTSFADNDIENTCITNARTAIERGFDACYADMLVEWGELYNRASISLENAERITNPPSMNALFNAFENDDMSLIPGMDKEENIQALDDYLICLLFHFGRYILASSSRNCLLPAALQGLWCRDLLSIWDGKYTTNINLQMNYWPVDSANLSECFTPYLKFMERVRLSGNETARKMYNCRGFVLHNNTDLWADTAVQDAGTHCSYWFTGGVWCAADMWEHYRYTRDFNYLVEAFPIMRDAALFVMDYMREVNGELVMLVSSSPENFYIHENGKRVSFCKMPAMDSELIELLFDNVLEACTLLKNNGETSNIPDNFEHEISAAKAKLAKTKIGKDGTILEWGEELTEAEPEHRHQSHLIGAYPYNNINEKRPELFEAVNKSIYTRIINGGGYNGWSRAWAAGLFARLGDGTLARDMITSMVRRSSQPNLFSCCNIGRAPKLMEDNMPMQIEGNMGTLQAVIEMLLHSHNDTIVVLPSLPESWKTGSFKGLVARGNVVVDCDWSDGKIKRVVFKPRVTGEYTINYGEGEKTLTLQSGDTY